MFSEVPVIMKHIMWNSSKTNCRKVIWATFFLLTLGLVVLVYYCKYDTCGDGSYLVTNPPTQSIISVSDIEAYKRKMLPENHFALKNLNKKYRLNFNHDVIVFLHMQKTGGTYLGRNLVRNLNIESPCKCVKGRKRCDCYTKNGTIWLFSRYSTGWRCGLHADWTELNPCVDDVLNEKEGEKRHRRYHYITLLRDPVRRYLSEWKHVQRGATWKAARLMCDGKPAKLPLCYSGEDWSGVTISEFVDCKYNLAKDRQTRMLSNLSLVNCYNESSLDSERRDKIMLQSAKDNLLSMDYFGLTEFQKYSQQLFEYTFNLEFIEKFTQLPVTHSDKASLTNKELEKVLEQNKLDIQLYQFAKDLFLQRVKYMKEEKKDYSAIEEYVEVMADGTESEVNENYEDETDAEDEDYV